MESWIEVGWRLADHAAHEVDRLEGRIFGWVGDNERNIGEVQALGLGFFDVTLDRSERQVTGVHRQFHWNAGGVFFGCGAEGVGVGGFQYSEINTGLGQQFRQAHRDFKTTNDQQVRGSQAFEGKAFSPVVRVLVVAFTAGQVGGGILDLVFTTWVQVVLTVLQLALLLSE